uniref:Uncharacterized protein n=1 Tax=Aegilops tauschii subsp. strangulata TaxID=200361 RepID=A0A453L0B4_AEGTS
MRNTPLGLLLLVCVAALHADASQEAQLRRFIRSRRSSSNANNIDEPKIHVLPGQPSGTIGLNQYG